MKYSRKRIIAVALLSVTMAVLLSGFGILWSLRDLQVKADDGDETSPQATTFEEAYVFTPITTSGQITLGQNNSSTTFFALRDEAYNSRTKLTTFLNRTEREPFSALERDHTYALFSDNDMFSIVQGSPVNDEGIRFEDNNGNGEFDFNDFNGNGKFDIGEDAWYDKNGNNRFDNGEDVGNDKFVSYCVKAPIVMLDNNSAVVFELMNLPVLPTDYSMTRDGEPIPTVDVKLTAGQSNDYVYGGVETINLPSRETIEAMNQSILNQITAIEARNAELKSEFPDTYQDHPNYVTTLEIQALNNQILDYDQLLANAKRTYEPGAVAISQGTTNSFRGIFDREGLYEFKFNIMVVGDNGMWKSTKLEFAFHIVARSDYENFPCFPTKFRLSDEGEVYNCAYNGEYPEVDYAPSQFAVKINNNNISTRNTNNPLYKGFDVSTIIEGLTQGNTLMQFYNVGEYKMVSTLKHTYTNYKTGKFKELTLDQYRPYTSTLNIKGFQAYYGGPNDNADYNGPLPFFKTKNGNANSDITTWVLEQKQQIKYNDPDAEDTKLYAKTLGNYLSAHPELQPLRTNFPPVHILGNVDHAEGLGKNGKLTVLSTVSYQAVDASDWSEPRALEPGEPFSDAGKYMVVVYYWVKSKLAQQVFYFEITNTIDLQFKIMHDDNSMTSVAFDTLSKIDPNVTYQGQGITIVYNENGVWGDFEVPPTLRLYKANLDNIYDPVEIKPTNIVNSDFWYEDGYLKFKLQEGSYRFVVSFGAYGLSESVINLVVDNTLASDVNIISNCVQDGFNNLPANMKIFGPGEASISWGMKKSGVAFERVEVSYYKLSDESEDKASDPNLNVNWQANYDKFDGKNLNAFAVFFENRTSKLTYIPKLKDGRWILNETFREPGLYRFDICDTVGNVSPYFMLIDESFPTFVQNTVKPDGYTNVVILQDDTNVKVGFGTQKLVRFLDNSVIEEAFSDDSTAVNKITSETLSSLVRENILTMRNERYQLVVPFSSVEINRNGEMYQDINSFDNTTNNRANGFVTLTDEGTYYLRVTDKLSNVSEYYIMLTRDASRGLIYAESTAMEFSTLPGMPAGAVEAEPNLDTSLVTSTGGMTNRQYLTFSFDQTESYTDPNRVSLITMEYHYFDWKCEGPNAPSYYPFSYENIRTLNHQDPSHENSIYYDNPASGNRLGKGTYRIALYNYNAEEKYYEPTRRGLYIIRRYYNADNFNPLTSSDCSPREYYFIVDDQAMLYYEKGVYESELLVRFGSDKKIADAEDFEKNNYLLCSNRVAEIGGYLSKYNNNRLQFYGYNFPSLTPRFSYQNNGQTVNLGEGLNIKENLGSRKTGDTNYKLIVADNARSFSIGIINGRMQELTKGRLSSANYSILSMEIDTQYGTSATIIKNGDKYNNAQMERDRNSGEYYFVVDPEDLEELVFQYEIDEDSFYADINTTITQNSWEIQGFDYTDRELQNLKNYERDGNFYNYDLYNHFLVGQNIQTGYGMSVDLVTDDGDHTKFNILFKLDEHKPTYNLQRIKDADNFAHHMSFEQLTSKYVYGMDHTFKFEPDSSGNVYLDTKLITYRQVTNGSSGEGSSPAVTFSLHDNRTFAEIVGLRDNEMKFYYITETDYAGHVTDYIVQLQGKNYNNDITFIGAVSEPGDNMILGIDMRVSVGSAEKFYAKNNSFKYVSGDDYYMVLNGVSSWSIDGKKHESTDGSSVNELVDILNTWVQKAATRGEKCSFDLYDRIGESANAGDPSHYGEPEHFECYSISERDAKIQMQAYNLIPGAATSSPVCLETTNYDKLSGILLMPELADKYKLEIIDVETNKDISQNTQYNVRQTTIYNIKRTQELIIRVTDPFKRVSITEYHGQDELGLVFTPHGNTFTNEDDVLFVGDNRGVSFQYLRSVYLINIYNAKTMEPVNNYDIYVVGDRVTYTFRPAAYTEDTSEYYIEAIGKFSNAVLWSKHFAFDTRMPNVIWTDTADQEIPVDNAVFMSAVNFRIEPNKNLPFETTVSYVRTWENYTQRVTLPETTTAYQFSQIGEYVVTLRNSIWATRTYRFEITDSGTDWVAVYDDGNLLKASDKMYQYLDEAITTYIFTLETDPQSDDGATFDLRDFAKHGLSQPVPIDNGGRRLIGSDVNTPYLYVNDTDGVIIWRLAVPTELDENDNPIDYVRDSVVYVATVGIERGNIGKKDSSISLIINDSDPIVPYYENSYKILTTKNIPNNGLKIKLHPSDNTGACYMHEGNLILVDCYRNGELVRTMKDGEVFEIGKVDAGYYQFRVHDLAGNKLMFGNGNDEQDYYEIAILTKPLVLINNSNPVNGMIYNDRVEFSLVNSADAFLRKQYSAEDFEKNFKILSMEVLFNGNELDMEKGETQNNFVWTKAGSYQVHLRYQMGESTLDVVSGDYEFQIVPSYVVMENFTMNTYSDIHIESIRRNGYLVKDMGVTEVGKPLVFNANENPGSYEVTFRSHDNVCGDRIYKINFNIGAKNTSSNNYYWLDTNSGQATTSPVTFSYQPLMLYYMRGNVTITVYKDYEVFQTIEIDQSAINEYDLNSRAEVLLEKTGLYSVRALDADGDVVFSDSWTINEAPSSIGGIVTAVVAGIGAIGLIFFLRLRRRMSVK